ncbi:glycosyltransferase, partial [Pandoraea pneumonica]|uniref:glycosyltransferase n=1 Tax=Pandoraea pneumonica TaxID=2508299 RepID=UPI003CE9CFE7
MISPHTELLDVVLTDAADLRLDVRWLGPGSAREILEQTAGAQFVLQLSAFEGLGMAVREAMALGIVPIVNPVGAIRGYSADG